MNECIVATRQRVSNPDWLVPNGAENRLQINFKIDLKIDAKSTPIPILNHPTTVRFSPSGKFVVSAGRYEW
jgi:hypothetical protein